MFRSIAKLFGAGKPEPKLRDDYHDTRHLEKMELQRMELLLNDHWDSAAHAHVYNHAQRALYDEEVERYLPLCKKAKHHAEAIHFFAGFPDAKNIIKMVRRSSREDILKGLRPTSSIERLNAGQMFELVTLLARKGITPSIMQRSMGVLHVALFWNSEKLFALGRKWGEIAISEQEHQDANIVSAIEHSDNACIEGIASLLEDAIKDPRKTSSLMSLADGFMPVPIKTVLTLQAIGISPTKEQVEAVRAAISTTKLSAHERLRCEAGLMSLREVLSMDFDELRSR